MHSYRGVPLVPSCRSPQISAAKSPARKKASRLRRQTLRPGYSAEDRHDVTVGQMIAQQEYLADGMVEEIITTKPTGEGTGLGLSISYDIVTQQHGGTIEVASEEGRLTEFTICLPRS